MRPVDGPWATLVTCTVLAACAASPVRVTLTKPEWKATAPTYVRVFTSAKAVPRPYDEIARLTVDDRRGSYPEMIAALREQASALGADAILLDEFTDENGSFDRLSARALTLYATTQIDGPKALARDACAASATLCRYERACKRGNAEACVGLGAALMAGTEIVRDAARAADYFDEACVREVPIACTHYGLALYQGHGREQNESQAIAMFKKACDEGEMGGCRYLGVLYLSSLNLASIASYAEGFLKRACNGGDAWSCWRLGKMLAEGEHVAAQPDRAPALYARACRLGLEYACELSPSPAEGESTAAAE